MLSKAKTLVIVALLTSAVAAVPAHADIITSLSSAPTATGDGFYAYTYNVQLNGGQLDATSNGSPIQFGTVYDFGPLVTTAGVISNPASAGSVFLSTTGLLSNSFAFSFMGSNTPASQTASNDNPLLTNIRFTYTGNTNYVVAGNPTTLTNYTTLAATANNLGTFTVYSPFSTYAPTSNYDGQSYKGSNNTVESNVGFVSTPQDSTPVTPAVPEPASWAMMILGMGAVGYAMRSAKRRSDEKFNAKIKRITYGVA